LSPVILSQVPAALPAPFLIYSGLIG
jgi:hypothetical protein